MLGVFSCLTIKENDIWLYKIEKTVKAGYSKQVSMNERLINMSISGEIEGESATRFTPGR